MPHRPDHHGPRRPPPLPPGSRKRDHPVPTSLRPGGRLDRPANPPRQRLDPIRRGRRRPLPPESPGAGLNPYSPGRIRPSIILNDLNLLLNLRHHPQHIVRLLQHLLHQLLRAQTLPAREPVEHPRTSQTPGPSPTTTAIPAGLSPPYAGHPAV